jgi:hypothetical protein
MARGHLAESRAFPKNRISAHRVPAETTTKTSFRTVNSRDMPKGVSGEDGRCPIAREA